MIFRFHKIFEKQFAKLPDKKRAAVKEAIQRFAADRRDPSLRFHALSGAFAGQSSISAGGDLRIHLKELDDGTVVVVMAVGSHSQLYR